MQTIIPRTREEARELARQLVRIAGPARKHEIRVIRTTSPAGVEFEVPEEFAEQVGPEPDVDSVAEEKPTGKGSAGGASAAGKAPAAGDPAGGKKTGKSGD